MKIRRVLCVAVLAAMLACATASQAANVKIRVAGFGGTDTAIVDELIARVVQPNLKGITVAYEPIPDAYDKRIVKALSARNYAGAVLPSTLLGPGPILIRSR